jgi:dTMP kinase
MARFIVFEGIDGSGKSSVAKAVASRLEREKAVLTEEPTKTWLGEAVRRSHAEKTDPFTEAFLFLADRATHTEALRKWLADGKTVVCDRYFHSTVAYQGAALEGKVDYDPFDWLLDANLKISLQPDIVFLFKVDPEIALQRVNARGSLSKFEKLDFLRKVASNYDKFPKMFKNIVVIDSNRPLDSVIADVMRRLEQGNV